MLKQTSRFTTEASALAGQTEIHDPGTCVETRHNRSHITTDHTSRNEKRKMLKKTITSAVVALGLCLAMTSPTIADIWVGAGGGGDGATWQDGLNWDDGNVPGGSSANIGTGDSVVLNWTTTATTADLDLTGGSTLTIRTNLAVGGDFDFYLGSAHVVIESGTVTAGDDLKMDNDASTFKMMGGSFENGVSPSQIGYFRMTDSGSRLEISGGSFSIEDDVNIQGTLQIIGDSATAIDFGTNGHEVTLQSVVELLFKDGGISTIDIVGNAALSGTLDVTLDGGFVLPGINTDYLIIDAGTRSGTFGTVNLPSGDWALNYAGSNVVLSYTAAIPEPSSMSLLALSGLAMLRRRRRA